MADFTTSIVKVIPTPVLIANAVGDDLNHRCVYVNPAFESLFGWTLEDIPDKQAWWFNAYPDPEYQIVVERQWELALETMHLSKEEHVMMKVNIMTKSQKTVRCKVFAEKLGASFPDHYCVAFVPEHE
ncbi:PAS domain-containing protein [Alteromonas flava]|uniref:PAS domain-containing protein n=1 Tax=Alteromonas flava TaxID=2048003 RepID=UPI000C2925FE|nr:PAS domain-containing protein [Alteromonas flava]